MSDRIGPEASGWQQTPPSLTSWDFCWQLEFWNELEMTGKGEPWRSLSVKRQSQGTRSTACLAWNQQNGLNHISYIKIELDVRKIDQCQKVEKYKQNKFITSHKIEKQDKCEEKHPIDRKFWRLNTDISRNEWLLHTKSTSLDLWKHNEAEWWLLTQTVRSLRLCCWSSLVLWRIRWRSSSRWLMSGVEISQRCWAKTCSRCRVNSRNPSLCKSNWWPMTSLKVGRSMTCDRLCKA